MHGWHLRWFTITPLKIVSVPDQSNNSKHRLRYPDFDEIEVDESRHIIRIKNPIEGKRDCKLHCFMIWHLHRSTKEPHIL